MYQLKVRIAGEAWQICLVLISTLMCMLAVFDRPSSPIGLIGIVFALIAAIVPMGMHGSWNRHYYSALATFPIMAVAILLANTVFRPAGSTHQLVVYSCRHRHDSAHRVWAIIALVVWL